MSSSLVRSPVGSVNLRAVFRLVGRFPFERRARAARPPWFRAAAGLGLACALGAGCSLPSPTQGRVLDAGATAQAGGMATLALATFQIRNNHTDLLTIDVTFPSGTSGTGAQLTGTAYPAVVLLQDKGVSAARYEALAADLAANRFVVATPHHVHDDPSFAPDDAADVYDFLVSSTPTLLQAIVNTENVTLLGHGEGGKVAAKVFGDRGWAQVGLLAALPDADDRRALWSFAGGWRAFAGSADCKVTPAALRQALAEAHPPTSEADLAAALDEHVVPLAGVAHEQFSAGSPATPCGDVLPVDQARTLIADEVVAFLSHTVADAGVSEGGAAVDAAAGSDAP